MNKFKVGDVVVFKKGTIQAHWPVTRGKEYIIIEANSDLVTIKEDTGGYGTYCREFFELCTNAQVLVEVQATAWKIGDVEFILEPNNKVYIIGNGEINIDVDILKKILVTLDNR